MVEEILSGRLREEKGDDDIDKDEVDVDVDKITGCESLGEESSPPEEEYDALLKEYDPITVASFPVS